MFQLFSIWKNHYKKKVIKEIEQGTPIKEAVQKVDPEKKRQMRDEEIRKEIGMPNFRLSSTERNFAVSD